MSVIEKSIELNVPVRTAYNQWTQFEEFPKFMEGVKQVTQIDDSACIGKPTSPARKKNGTRKSRSRFRINVLPGRAGEVQ